MSSQLADLVSSNDPSHPDWQSCEVPTTCQPPSAWGKDPWPATIRTIGTMGLNLSLARRFERGSGLAIELPGDDGLTSTVLARVVKIRPETDGYWLLECSFISELSEEEVGQVLGLDAVHQASLEEDGPAASQATVSGVLFQAKQGPGEVLRWFIKRLDLSSSWPPERGRVVSLRLGGSRADAAPVSLTIRRCRMYGSYWVIDCAFAETPDPETFRTLATPSDAPAPDTTR